MPRSVRSVCTGVLVSALAASTLPLLVGGTAYAAPGLFDGLSGPSLVGPDDEHGTTTPVVKDLVLDWTPVEGAVRYQVQVSPNEDWTNNLTLDEEIVPTRWAPPVTLPQASYSWRSRALGPAGELGAWSDAGDKRAWTFRRDWIDRPTIASPSVAAPAPSMTDLRFSWRPIQSASFYEVEVRDRDLDVVGLCYTNHTTVSPYVIDPKLPTADERERVHRNGGCSDPTDVRGELAAPVVKPTGPIESAAGASSLSGRAFFDTDQDGRLDPGETGRGNIKITLSREIEATETEPAGTEEVAVRGTDGLGNWTVNGLAGGTYTPRADLPAEKFEQQSEPVALDPDETRGGADTALRTVGEQLNLVPGQPYQWRVRGRDGTGVAPLDVDTSPTGTECRQVDDPVSLELGEGDDVPECSGWSALASFTYSPGAPAYGNTLRLEDCPQSTDREGVAACTDTPTITWPGTGTGVGKDIYRVDVSLKPTFDTVLRVYYTHNRSLTPRDSLVDAQADRAYYVRVTGPGIDGATAAFSKRSSPTTLSSPAAGARLRDRHITFRWEDYLATGGTPGQEAQAYRLQVSRGPDFETRELVDDAIVDLTEHTSPDRELVDGQYFWRVQPIDAGRNNLTWSETRSFVRDTVRPTAALRSPAVAAVNAPILVQFSEPVDGATASSVVLRDSGNKTVPATVSLSADRRTATLTPSGPLIPGMPYRVLLTSAIRDLVGAGNPMLPTTLFLSADPTVDSSSPAVLMRWDRDASGVASGGSFATSSTKGAQLEFPFSGTSLSIDGRRAPDGGYADVYVDGKFHVRTSYYASKPDYTTVYKSRAPLSAGPHTMRLVVSGSGPAASTGTIVAVDTVHSATTTYQDDSPGVTQSWADYGASDAIGRSYRTEKVSAQDSGTKPSASVRFYGTSGRVLACKSPGSGRADIVVDGKLRATVDLYQSFTSCGVQVYATPALPLGVHTVGLVATGTQSTRATGARVSFDALRTS